MGDHIGRRPSEVLPARARRGRRGTILDRGARDRASVIADDDFTAVSPVTGELATTSRSGSRPGPTPGAVIGVAVLVSDVTDAAPLRGRAAPQQGPHRPAAAGDGGAWRGADRRRRTPGDRRDVRVVQPAWWRDSIRDRLSAGGQSRRLPRRGPATRGHAAGIVALPLVVSGGQHRHPAPALARGQGGRARRPGLPGALAGQCAIALERARLYERERSTAAALQRSLLPDRLPDAPGSSWRRGSGRARPRPTWAGDWYDAFALPDGRLVLVVGDVMGKGVIGRRRDGPAARGAAGPRPGQPAARGGAAAGWTGSSPPPRSPTRSPRWSTCSSTRRRGGRRSGARATCRSCCVRAGPGAGAGRRRVRVDPARLARAARSSARWSSGRGTCCWA